MKVTIPYGNKEINFDIPDKYLYTIYSPNNVKEANDLTKEIENAINNPVGSPGLKDIVFEGCSVSILCDDNTRPTPAWLILEILIPKLLEYGVKKEKIKILMALGTHRYMTEEEMIKKVGLHIYKNYKVINSEFKDKKRIMNLGKAPDGVEIWACKDAMESDIRIGLGNIVPHPVSGWSGGGKIMCPGIAGEETVAKFHFQHGLAGINMFGMENCPVRIKMEKWVDKVGLHFIINTVLAPEKKIFKIVAGHFIAAQREGVKFGKILFGKKISEKSDIVIVSSCPADIDFWQGTKGVFCGEHILNDGGTLLLVTPCYEGVGPHEEYIYQIGNNSAEEVLRRVEKGEKIEGDPIALAIGTTISRIRKRIKLALVSDGITKEEAKIAKFEYYENVQQAINNTIRQYTNPKISVITHGGELFLY